MLEQIRGIGIWDRNPVDGSVIGLKMSEALVRCSIGLDRELLISLFTSAETGVLNGLAARKHMPES